MVEQVKPDVYVVLRASGTPMRFRGGLLNDSNSHPGPYRLVLDAVATDQQSAGSGHDSAVALYLNGKCVVEKGLSTIAWQYQRDSMNARTAAQRAVDAMYEPAWAEVPSKGGVPMYQEAEVAKWQVTKRGAG